MRRLLLVLSIFCFLPLAASSAEELSAKLSTGFISQPVAGHFWAMTTSYRASFSPGGIQLIRHGRRASIRFPNASLHWQLDGEPMAPIHFLGPETRSLSSASSLRAINAYPGVDIVLRLQDGRLKSEFQLAAGVAPSTAGYCVEGARVRPGRQGRTVEFDAGEDWRWSEEGLVSWQTRPGGARVPIASQFAVHGSCVSFRLAPLDASLPVTIDPDLVFSTYLSGGLFDAITGIATDPQGNVYLGGWTESSDFPVLSGYRTTSGGRIDGFVAKVNAAGQLQYSSYLGGSNEDRVLALSVNSAGLITVAGVTSSTNFPVLFAVRSTLTGGRDAFVTRFLAAGNQLVFSTYLGGSGNDAALAVTHDANGMIVVAGETASTDFPVQSAYNTSSSGGVDGFLTRLSPTGALQSSTYFGGSSDDRIRAVAVAADGAIHIAGTTSSSNLPVLAAPFSSLRGSMDGFYTRLNPSANGLILSTYLGGSAGSSLNEEGAYGVAIDTLGRAWIAGVTPSTDFPGVSGGYQTTYGGGVSDAFVSVFTVAGALEWSTYIGGTGIDAATSIAAGSGFVGLAGYTTSLNLPVSGALQSTRAGEYDAFWAAFPVASNRPLYISYLGGAGSDSALAAAASGSSLAIAGSTLSSDLPLTLPVQWSNPGAYGGFASRVRFGPGPITVTPSPASGITQTFQFTVSHATGSASMTNAAVLFNSSNSFANGCYYYLDKSNNIISLYNDATATWLNATLGSATTLNNGRCSTPAGGVTVTTTANSLILTLPVTAAAAAFSGARNIYANTTDTAGLGAGWPQVGTWNIVATAAPTVAAATPSSGVGPTQVFSFPFDDANGANDIETASIAINSVFSTANGCYFTLNRTANTLSLFRDSDAALLPLTPGANVTVENTKCAIVGTGVSVTTSGTQLVLNVPVTFKTGFNGPHTVYASVSDLGHLTSGWQTVGSWNPFPVYAPTVVAASPASGGGSSQAFTISLSDGNGFADIASAGVLFHTVVSSANGCYITYTRDTNTFALFRDADSTFLPVTPGASIVVENTNCSLSGTGLTVSGAGSQLVAVLPLTFKPPFAGTKNIYATAADSGGLTSGWQAIGTWNPYPAYAPTVLALQPATGAGLSRTFNFHYSDGNGNGDIATLSFVFNSSLNTASGCYLTYSRSANSLSLYNPADSTWASLSPGSGATVQNTYCSLAGANFTTSAADNDFSINLPVTFKPASFGTLALFTVATDSAGLSSGWISAGTWAAGGPATPAIISLAPASGAAASQIFTATVSDANGNGDIATVQFLVNSSTNPANGCYLSYSRSANTVSLFRDADSAWLPVAVGGSTSASNSFCTLSGTGLSVTASGDSLVLTLPLTFKPAFSGVKSIFLSATDLGDLTSGWVSVGSWSVSQPVAPAIASLTPSSGSAAIQNFTIVFSDLNGYGDIASAMLLVNATLNGTNGCFLSYDRGANIFFLFRDSDSAWLPIYPNGTATVSNAQCSINTANLITVFSGSTVTVTLPLAFSGTFTGSKNFYASVADLGGLSSGWQTAGTWNPGQPIAPSAGSVSPASGSGLTQTFTVVLTDANGAADISSAQFLVNTTLNGTNSCYILFNRAANYVYLFKDASNVWQPVTPGSSATVSNNNCSLSGTGLTVTASGNSITLTLPLTFTAAYSGANNFYVYAVDNGGLSSGWVTAGTWSTGQPAAPSASTVSPSSGSGQSQTFSVVLSDANGAADISSAQFIVNASLNGMNSCYILFNRAANYVYLFKDAGNVWQPIVPGANTSVTNGNCTLSGTGLTVTPAGNSLTLTLPLTFSASYSGVNNLYVYSADNGGLSSGWITAGTWNIGQPAVPAVTSLSPSTGAGTSQTFTLTLTDANGNADITSALVLLNSNLDGNSACFISYNRGSNAFYLFRDSDGAWQPITPGSATTVTNNNCTISGATLAVSASGNALALTLPLSFKPAFRGARNVYASVTDAGGLTSPVANAGIWTVP